MAKNSIHGWSMVAGLCVVIAFLVTLQYLEYLHHPGLLTLDPTLERFSGPARLSTYALRLVAQYDPSAQATGYRVAVLCTALALVGCVATRAFLGRGVSGRLNGRAIGAWPLVALLWLGVIVWCANRDAFWRGRKRELVVAGLCIVAALWLWRHVGRAIRHRGWNRRLAVMAFAGIVLAVVPSFFLVPDWSSIGIFQLLFINDHYSMVLGQADRLAAGQALFTQVKPHYGVVFQMLLAGVQAHVQPLSLGETIQVLSVFNGLYLVLCALLFRRFSRGHWLLVILGLSLLVPSYHFAHLSLAFPNQAAWRTLFFPIALGCAWWSAGRRPVLVGLVFGAVAALALLWNFETGIAVTAGLSACLVFSSGLLAGRRRVADLAAFMAFPCGAVAGFAAFMMAWRCVLGDWPDPRGFVELYRSVLTRAGNGFGGLRYLGSMPPLGLLGWSACALVRQAIVPVRTGSGAASVRVCAASLSLVWLAYYFNRPDPWNLSSYGVLLAIPTIDACRQLVQKGGSNRLPWQPRLGVAAAFIATVSVPYLLQTVSLLEDNRMPMRVGVKLAGAMPADRMLLSGVIFERRIARDVQEKAEFIRQHADGAPVAYVAKQSYLVPKLAGIPTSLPFTDLVVDSVTETEYFDNLAAITRRTGDLLVESADSGDVFYDGFYRSFLADVATRSVLSREEHGWLIWVADSANVP